MMAHRQLILVLGWVLLHDSKGGCPLVLCVPGNISGAIDRGGYLPEVLTRPGLPSLIEDPVGKFKFEACWTRTH